MAIYPSNSSLRDRKRQVYSLNTPANQEKIKREITNIVHNFWAVSMSMTFQFEQIQPQIVRLFWLSLFFPCLSKTEVKFLLYHHTISALSALHYGWRMLLEHPTSKWHYLHKGNRLLGWYPCSMLMARCCWNQWLTLTGSWVFLSNIHKDSLIGPPLKVFNDFKVYHFDFKTSWKSTLLKMEVWSPNLSLFIHAIRAFPLKWGTCSTIGCFWLCLHITIARMPH